MHIPSHTHLYIYHTYIHASIHTRMDIHNTQIYNTLILSNTYTHTHINTHTQTHTQTHTHTHTHTQTHTYTHLSCIYTSNHAPQNIIRIAHITCVPKCPDSTYIGGEQSKRNTGFDQAIFGFYVPYLIDIQNQSMIPKRSVKKQDIA